MKATFGDENCGVVPESRGMFSTIAKASQELQVVLNADDTVRSSMNGRLRGKCGVGRLKTICAADSAVRRFSDSVRQLTMLHRLVSTVTSAMVDIGEDKGYCPSDFGAGRRLSHISVAA